MSRRLAVTVLEGLTDLDSSGTLNQADLANVTELSFYVLFDDDSSAGTVLIETAPTSDYDGTWAVLDTVNWAAAGKCHYVAITGAFGAVRARISSAITDGTVTVKALGNFR